MVRVGILVPALGGWTGGINYLRNLLRSAALIREGEMEFVLFWGQAADLRLVDSFEGLGEIVRTPVLDDDNLIGRASNLCWRFFGRSPWLDREFKKARIDVVSHSRFFSGSSGLGKINWIPDFQHLYLPEMFSKSENLYRKYLFGAYARRSDLVVVSSRSAYQDFAKTYPDYSGRSRVLPFVSWPNDKIYSMENVKAAEAKFGFSGKFFYLPNQLWRHKNHLLILRAVNLLKRGGKEILVLCTGSLDDYRNRRHKEEIFDYIRDNKLEQNVMFLGLIDYDDVLVLMRHCISIINPSLFEGWSSSVEEAKSIGKNVILSDLPVHREQDPPGAVYFDPSDERGLAMKLWEKWEQGTGGPDLELEKRARQDFRSRAVEFGRNYQAIVLEVAGK